MAENTERVVVDASVTLAWILPDESTRFTEALFDFLATGRRAVVPSIWPAELANGTMSAERSNRISAGTASGFLTRLSRFPILVDSLSLPETFEKVLPLARIFHLTFYDAMYLELALRLALPLATLDKELIKCAPLAGVSLWT